MDPAGLVHAPAAAAHKEEPREVWGWLGSSEPRTDPAANSGGSTELPWPQLRTRHRSPNLLLQLSRTRSAAWSARVFLPRQENTRKGFFPAAENILANFWLYFNFGRRGEAAASG